MNECDRRDVGMFVIIATGVTARHCRRLGQGPSIAGVRAKNKDQPIVGFDQL